MDRSFYSANCHRQLFRGADIARGDAHHSAVFAERDVVLKLGPKPA